MTKLHIPDEIYEELDHVSRELTGIKDSDELALFVLESFLEEITKDATLDMTADDSDAVEDRLKQLGYVE